MAFFIFFVLFVFPFLQAGPLDNWASFLAWAIFIIIPLIVTVLLKVPTTMHGPESGPLTPAEVAERMARTDFIIEEYKTGILDEHEAGAELFHHLFPNEH